jgi:FkbM family methyltransferase
MKNTTLHKLKLLHAWQLPLKERITRWLIPTHNQKNIPFYTGVAYAQNGCLLNVDTTNYIEYKVFAEGGYEVYLSTLIKHYVKPHTIFLDIGANIGIHSLSVAKMPDAQIYSFEPIDFIREKLQKNIALNNYANINIVPVALSNENKVIKTNFSAQSTNQGTFSMQHEAEGDNEITCIIGDEYVAQHNIYPISVIKIDVEGFEFAVLTGLTQTITSQKPVIFFEYDYNYISRGGNTAADYEDLFFNTLHYKLFVIEKFTLIPCLSLKGLTGMKEIMALPN